MHFGKSWKIDGVIAGYIHGPGSKDTYTVLFERELAELADIEKINWDKPVIERLNAWSNERGLPEGCGFKVENITYEHGVKSYKVELSVDKKYWGDVTGYQAQVAELQTTVTEQAAVIQTQETELETKESTIQAQTATISQQEGTIQEQTATIESLKESGSAALEADLDAAYEEGVNSVE